MPILGQLGKWLVWHTGGGRSGDVIGWPESLTGPWEAVSIWWVLSGRAPYFLPSGYTLELYSYIYSKFCIIFRSRCLRLAIYCYTWIFVPVIHGTSARQFWTSANQLWLVTVFCTRATYKPTSNVVCEPWCLAAWVHIIAYICSASRPHA